MNILKITVLALFLALGSTLQAQDFKDLDKSPMDVASFPSSYKIADKEAKIAYSRPQLKNRSLDNLAPSGKVWRTGANEAPEITFYKDVVLGDNTIKAGTYSLFTIPNGSEWTAIISSDINVWGAYTYNKSNDVARLTVPATTANNSLEAFSMAFTKSGDELMLHLGWDTTRVTIPFTVK